MAFFRDTYDPDRGDIVYGLDKTREKYFDHWIRERLARDLEEAIEDEGLDTIDDPDKAEYYTENPDDYEADKKRLLEWQALIAAYRDESAPLDLKKREEKRGGLDRKLPTINLYNDPILAASYRDPSRIDLRGKGGDPRIASYQDVLHRTRYAPRHAGGAGLASLGKGEETLQAKRIEDIEQTLLVDLLGTVAIRRACKFGIEYVAKSAGTVHYALDGIVMPEVLAKKTYPLFGGHVGVPITTSELRFMFRQWRNLGPRAAQGRLLFYRAYATCDAPWVSDPAQWLPYAQHLADRFAGSPAGATHGIQLQEFRRLAAVHPGQALAKFHELPVKEELIPTRS
jgi:hypothetical protein